MKVLKDSNLTVDAILLEMRQLQAGVIQEINGEEAAVELDIPDLKELLEEYIDNA